MSSPAPEGERQHQADEQMPLINENPILTPAVETIGSANNVGSNSDVQSKDDTKSVAQMQGNGPSVLANEITTAAMRPVDTVIAADQSALKVQGQNVNNDSTEMKQSLERIADPKSNVDVAGEMQTSEEYSKSEIANPSPNVNTATAAQSIEAKLSREEVMSRPIPRKSRKGAAASQQNSAAVAESLPVESEEKKSDSDDDAKRVVKRNIGSPGSNVSHLETASHTAKSKSAKQIKSAKRTTKRHVADRTKQAKKARKVDDTGKKKSRAETGKAPSNNKRKTTRNIQPEKTSPKHKAPVIPSEDSAAIDLVSPLLNDPTLVSRYEKNLVQNVEFFYPSKSTDAHYVNHSPSSSYANILGVRCIHCNGYSASNPRGNDSAAVFPKNIKSIADAIKYIGRMHLDRGRCRHVDPKMAIAIKESKPNNKSNYAGAEGSYAEGVNGKISLEKYCLDVAFEYGLTNHEVEGVLWDGKAGTPSILGSQVEESPEQQVIIQPANDNEGIHQIAPLPPALNTEQCSSIDSTMGAPLTAGVSEVKPPDATSDAATLPKGGDLHRLSSPTPDDTHSSIDKADTSSHGSRDPSLVIDLIPKGNGPLKLSDYNNLLVRNCEFFYPAKSHMNYKNLSGSKNTSNMSEFRIGLRCIHCKDNPTHTIAAAFFPSAISTISSGLGTIGSRHFGLGNCPNVHPNLVRQLAETKDSSSDQSRSLGHIGLNAYCKNLAKQYGIYDDEVSGVCWNDGKEPPHASSAETALQSGASSTTRRLSPRDRKSPPRNDGCIYYSDDAELFDEINPERKAAADDAIAPQGAAAARNASRRSTRNRKAPDRIDPYVSLNDNNDESFIEDLETKRKSNVLDTQNNEPKRRKRGRKRATNDSEPSIASSSAAASLSSAPAQPSKQRVKPKSSFSTGLDPKVLDRLQPQEQGYCEESAYRFHNPPFPENRQQQQLAIVREDKIPGDMKPIESIKLAPLPLPSDSDLDPNSLRQSDHCTWSFDEKLRVLLADFLAPADKHNGKIVVTHEDKEFLFSMMQRDDITVISEGLAGKIIKSSLFEQDYIKTCIGSQYHHKVKEFRKTEAKPSGCIITGETDGLYDETKWHSMTFNDYFAYLEVKQQQAQNDEDTQPGSIKKTFSFVDCDGHDVTIDPTESVLYMLDLDMIKMLPRAYNEFREEFKIPEILPGGKHCMMNSVNTNGRPFMGPNIYMTPPSSFTQFHQDGHGTVDSGHLCCRGYNEVVMLRRLPERHKLHALHLLNGTSSSSGSFLYGKPHDLQHAPLWPTNEAIEECKKMGYCPSVFILKPGQLVHINKGRLHAFRKLSASSLREDDCHHCLREDISPSLDGKNLTCFSVAWDWMFKGVTDEGINREVSSILECARLNQKQHVQSLAIPETALLFLARDQLGLLNVKDESDDFKSEAMNVLRGILPSLQHVVHRHKMAEEASKMWKKGGKHKKVSIDTKPNTAQNPDSFSLDPHGNSDFICKFCSDELSNLYMHCEGCERLLNKDFNICTTCHADEKYKTQMRMHPFNKKMKSTLNHTGKMNFQRRSHCPCHNGPQCDTCLYCIGCSCTCHQHFTLHYRFMTMQEEMRLLQDVVNAVGNTPLPTSLETMVRLFSLMPRDSHVPAEALTIGATASKDETAENDATKVTAANDDDMTECTIVADTCELSQDAGDAIGLASDNVSETADGVCPVSNDQLGSLTKGSRVMIRLKSHSDDWNAEVLKFGSGRKEGQFQIRYEGQKESVKGVWVKRTDITGILDA